MTLKILILLALSAVSTSACSPDLTAQAVVPHVPGQLDYVIPADYAEVASAMRAQFEAGPAPFEIIECENSYLEGSQPPKTLHPSLWVRNDDALDLVAAPFESKWSSMQWSADFESQSGERVVCDGANISHPRAGEAWSAFVYPRGLLRNETWLRPGNWPYGRWSREDRELATLGGPWNEAKVRRLIDLNPHPYYYPENHWKEAIAWVETNGDDDLKYELLRRYHPAGVCHNDRGPELARNRFLRFCLETQRIECVAGLLADYETSEFPDPAYTEIEMLPDGVDGVTYAIGMALRYPGSPGNQVFRREVYFDFSDLMPQILDGLRRVGKDSDTDPYNRHLIAMAMANRSFPGGEQEEMTYRNQLADAEWVPAATAAWLRQPTDF